MLNLNIFETKYTTTYWPANISNNPENFFVWHHS